MEGNLSRQPPSRQQRGGWERALTILRGWIEAAHPFPLLAVLVLTALVGVASAQSGELDITQLVLVLIGMLFCQLAIGWTNDYADRHTDRRLRPSKPVAAGRVDAALLPPAVVLACIGGVVVGVILGPQPLLFLIIGTAAGLSYDLWLKETRWSWAPFIVAFAVLPLYAWSALDIFRRELLAVYVIAMPLVPAVHVANVLPDMEADVLARRRNLAVIFGREKALRVIAVCMAAPIVLIAFSLPLAGYDLQMLALVLAGYLTFAAVATGAYFRRLDSLAFKFVVAASVLLAGGWLAAA